MKNIENLIDLTGIQIDNIEISDNEVVIRCSSPFHEQICPKCKNKCSRVPKYY
jgi:hypothetical protein